MLKKNDPKKRHGIIVVAVLIAVSFIFLTVNIKFGEAPTSVESIVVSIISPFQELVSKTLNSINRIWNSYVHLVNTQEENYKLKREMEQLKFKNNMLSENLGRFQRLERLSDIIKNSEDINLLPADVVGFDSTGWSKMLIINKGLNNAVKKDMAVITYNGLVGRVVHSTSKYSKVLLITDPRSAVGALIQRTRDMGIAVGANNSICEMKYLTVNSDVKTGDVVVSSGMGGIFQKGLVIGTISRVYEKKTGLFRNAEIIPAADLDRTEELLVVTSPFEKPEAK